MKRCACPHRTDPARSAGLATNSLIQLTRVAWELLAKENGVSLGWIIIGVLGVVVVVGVVMVVVVVVVGCVWIVGLFGRGRGCC